MPGRHGAQLGQLDQRRLRIAPRGALDQLQALIERDERLHGFIVQFVRQPRSFIFLPAQHIGRIRLQAALITAQLIGHVRQCRVQRLNLADAADGLGQRGVIALPGARGLRVQLLQRANHAARAEDHHDHGDHTAGINTSGVNSDVRSDGLPTCSHGSAMIKPQPVCGTGAYATTHSTRSGSVTNTEPLSPRSDPPTPAREDRRRIEIHVSGIAVKDGARFVIEQRHVQVRRTAQIVGKVRQTQRLRRERAAHRGAPVRGTARDQHLAVGRGGHTRRKS